MYLFHTPDKLDFDDKQELQTVWNLIHFNLI